MHFPKFFTIIFILQVLIFSFCESQQCAKPPKTIQVDQSGYKQFKTIQSAIDTVPQGNSQWIHILISPGVYKEKVKIDTNKPCIFLEGAGRNSTTIQWGDSGTAKHTATVELNGNNTLVKGITFENTHNTIDSTNVTQAVAVRVHADKCAFIDCGFIGVQDTLYDSFGRHYYHNCYIQGATDFIFGTGQSIFEDCEIFFSNGLGSPKDGIITANDRKSEDDPSAFVFKKCTINGKGGKTNLGRALKPGNPRVIIANSFFANVIRKEGWAEKNFFQGHE
ncbi:putative pectinesterase [Lupinus albus]|uniref:Pectinesterase n=1 Tax=Lupinus albus TaxID=3870 RepID=A0A6A4P8F4_LUPAL|nr:putative pectinesterase [Lupinus albus]